MMLIYNQSVPILQEVFANDRYGNTYHFSVNRCSFTSSRSLDSFVDVPSSGRLV